VGATWPGTGRAQEEGLAESGKKFEEMMANVNDFVGDVRFDEADVVSLIELWDEYNEFGEQIEDDDEEIVDFDEIVADPEYRRWAASHGLDAKPWLQKTVRITMTLYREQVLQSAEQMPQQMQQQLEMIEQQRDQFGEEAYQQMKQAMEESVALTEQMVVAAKKFPEANASEMAALESHRDQLMMLMMSDDEEDEYGYGEEYDDDGDWD
jgi:methyl-accepting chemotaxis protein